MGREASCEVRVNQRTFKAKAELEGESIVVRGPEGFRMRFDELTAISADKGVLSLADPKREAALVLGEEAALWAERARAPRGRMEKLGIKAKTRVNLVGQLPKDLREEVQQSGAVIVRGGAVDMILFGPAQKRDLGQLDVLRELIAPSGEIWVIREKGSEALTERDLRAAAKEHKLVAIKVAKLSETHTADKLVIPRADR